MNPVAPPGPTLRASAQRPTVGIVGAGRVGAVLGAALRAAGYPLPAISARSTASRRRAKALLADIPLREPADVARSARLVLLAVPDDQLPGLVADWAREGVLRPGQVVAHTSGRYGIAVLEPLAELGVTTLALHPAMTFAGTVDDLPRLAGVAYGVTALGRHWPLAERLVADLGGQPVSVPEQLRPLWHAGLAHGANHLVTLVASALDVVRATGASDPAAVLRPLLTAALDRALATGDDALTGPVARGDVPAVAGHLDALDAAVPSERPLYTALAAATARRRPRPDADMLALLDAAARQERAS